MAGRILCPKRFLKIPATIVNLHIRPLFYNNRGPLQLANAKLVYKTSNAQLDFELKKVLSPPPLGNFADISYLEENFKPHLLRDVCTLCSGALVSDSLLHMLL